VSLVTQVHIYASVQDAFLWTPFSLSAMADIPLQVVSDNTASERRITPSWTISQLKTKLVPITGIPYTSQKLSLKLSGSQNVPVEAADEEQTQLSSFPLAPYAELIVSFRSPLLDLQTTSCPRLRLGVTSTHTPHIYIHPHWHHILSRCGYRILSHTHLPPIAHSLGCQVMSAASLGSS
jgi:hypothetical protein